MDIIKLLDKFGVKAKKVSSIQLSRGITKNKTLLNFTRTKGYKAFLVNDTVIFLDTLNTPFEPKSVIMLDNITFLDNAEQKTKKVVCSLRCGKSKYLVLTKEVPLE